MTQSYPRTQDEPHRPTGSTSAALAAPLEEYARRLRAELRVVEGQLSAILPGAQDGPVLER